jgi:hypothetical protein
VGDDGAHAAWLILQHAPTKLQAEILPRLEKAATTQDVRLGDLALLQDRVLADMGKPQIYGSQTRYTPNGGPPTLAPITNEPCVDRRRARVGLEPLAEYLRRFGFEYHAPTERCRER